MRHREIDAAQEEAAVNPQGSALRATGNLATAPNYDLTFNRHEVRRRLQEVDQDTEERNALSKSFQTSFEEGDYVVTLQCWSNMRSGGPPTVGRG